MYNNYTISYESDDGHKGVHRVSTNRIYDESHYQSTAEAIEKYTGYKNVHITGFIEGIYHIEESKVIKMNEQDRKQWYKEHNLK